MIFSDYPIKTKKYDLLKRFPLASKVADLIRNFNGRESFVVGIEGPWGSGKTSFINLVLNELEGDDKIITVLFNPWNFIGQNELISDFFSSVLAAVDDGSGTNSKLTKTIKSYTSKLKISFSPSVSLPFIGSVGLGEIWRKKDKSLKQERDEIDCYLKKLNKKIIVVIDDIDRLDKDEIRLIMKLVKMTANFPNTIFLLAYERERIVEMLQNSGWSGEEYLKKIIQVSFSLPKPDQQGLLRILTSDLDDTIKAVYGEVDLNKNDEQHWRGILYAGFRDLFKTIRDIKRYMSSLRLNWSIMGKDDVNIIDFIGIEAIRVFAPKFYSAISANKALFTDTGNLFEGLGARDDESAKENNYKELLQTAPGDLLEPIDGICKKMFPQLDFKTHYAENWQREWRNEKRICAGERFAFYFQLGIPEGAVSEGEITNLLKTLRNRDNFSTNILRFNDEKRLRQVLSKVQDKIETLDEDQVKNLVASLWNLEQKIDDDRTSVFDFEDIDMQTVRITFSSLDHKVKKEDRVKFLTEILNGISVFSYATKFVALLEDDSKKKSSQNEEPLIAQEDIKKLTALLVEKINKLAEKGELQNQKNFPSMLFMWKRWENKEKVSNYLENLIKTRSGLLSLLCGFVSTILSSNDNYKILNKDSIGELMPIEKVEQLVAAITEGDLKEMELKEREAIELFRNPKKNRW